MGSRSPSLALLVLASPIESLAVLDENYQRYHLDVTAAGQAAVQTIPVMRSVFVTEDDALAERVRGALDQTVPSSMRPTAVAVDDWAVVGDRRYTRDKLVEYIETLGLSHLIVRAGIPGVSEEAQLRSHSDLLEIVSGL